MRPFVPVVIIGCLGAMGCPSERQPPAAPSAAPSSPSGSGSPAAVAPTNATAAPTADAECPSALPTGSCSGVRHCRYDGGDHSTSNDADARVDCDCSVVTKDPATKAMWVCLER